jgi:hypothetical protein
LHYEWWSIWFDLNQIWFSLIFSCFHVVFNNSSLLMSISNLIWIDINFHGHEKTHVNLFSGIDDDVGWRINPKP